MLVMQPAFGRGRHLAMCKKCYSVASLRKSDRLASHNTLVMSWVHRGSHKDVQAPGPLAH